MTKKRYTSCEEPHNQKRVYLCRGTNRCHRSITTFGQTVSDRPDDCYDRGCTFGGQTYFLTFFFFQEFLNSISPDFPYFLAFFFILKLMIGRP